MKKENIIFQVNDNDSFLKQRPGIVKIYLFTNTGSADSLFEIKDLSSLKIVNQGFVSDIFADNNKAYTFKTDLFAGIVYQTVDDKTTVHVFLK